MRTMCLGGCGYELVRDRREQKGGRRLNHSTGYCLQCWNAPRRGGEQPERPKFTDEQQRVRGLVRLKLPRTDQQRDVLAALGLSA